MIGITDGIDLGLASPLPASPAGRRVSPRQQLCATCGFCYDHCPCEMEDILRPITERL